jgi:hypothetical protein
VPFAVPGARETVDPKKEEEKRRKEKKTLSEKNDKNRPKSLRAALRDGGDCHLPSRSAALKLALTV